MMVNETTYDQGLAFCVELGKGSENINYIPCCYVNLFMDIFRIWQKKVKLQNKFGLHFSKESLPIWVTQNAQDSEYQISFQVIEVFFLNN